MTGVQTCALPICYTHLTTQSEALATQRIDALMSRFNLGWGAVK